MFDSTDLQSQPWRALRVCIIINDALHKSERTSEPPLIYHQIGVRALRRLSELQAADSYRSFFSVGKLQKHL